MAWERKKYDLSSTPECSLVPLGLKQQTIPDFHSEKGLGRNVNNELASLGWDEKRLKSGTIQHVNHHATHVGFILYKKKSSINYSVW